MGIKRILPVIIVLLLIGILAGWTETKSTQISVLATTDLHGAVPYNMAEYIKKERENDPNISLVDAGDFLDMDRVGGAMDKYFQDKLSKKQTEIVEFGNEYVEFPLANDMKEVGYDAVVLGNHEFMSNNKFHLDNMIYDFEKNNIDVLSANTYKENNESYTKPYTIKQIDTKYGKVKLGILGLTIKEVNDGEPEDEKRDLKDMDSYAGKLYMNDLVEDAKKWTKIMEEKENTDIIVAVAHSGEKPKKPKHPGNRIQELAQEVEGIDAIVAGHTHTAFEQHDYKNKSGENVIVTQPGKHGECISKITFELEKDKEKWKVKDKYVKLTEFEKDKSNEYASELMYKIEDIKKETKEINLKEITPFEWDKAYVFDKNTPIEEIYEKVGYKWRSIAKQEKGYEFQMVFMKDGKVVSDLIRDTMEISMKFDESIYKDGIIEIEPNKNDKFSVKKDQEDFETNLTYIEE
ncbi:MAG: metallophosphoesterase [Terrisporobacter sp.]